MLTAPGGFRDKAGEVNLQSLTAPLQPYMRALDAFLDARVAEFEREVQPLVRYTFAHSGKRLRPLLVFFSGLGNAAAHDALVKAAAVVELVHLATLVHDDILDEADMRHKAPTIVVEHGPHVAVLLGDALFAEALRLAASYPTPQICYAVALATRRVCAGEIGQTFQRGDLHTSVADYLRVIEGKTADLFAVSCYVGALLAHPESGFPQAAETYGRHLGIAYQMFDDVADLVGDASRIGKTLGTDLATGKFTLPLIYLFEGRDDAERARLAGLLREDLAREDLVALLDREGVMQRVVAAFDAQLDAARAALAPYGTLPPVAPLNALTTFVHQQMAGMLPERL